ncbi:hypothetical protein ANO11243_084480 [Dothideomycetidae sp. 11243]|nr:hypothetical protein ANO11243_084480 [fungal sp. No.11243]
MSPVPGVTADQLADGCECIVPTAKSTTKKHKGPKTTSNPPPESDSTPSATATDEPSATGTDGGESASATGTGMDMTATGGDSQTATSAASSSSSSSTTTTASTTTTTASPTTTTTTTTTTPFVFTGCESSTTAQFSFSGTVVNTNGDTYTQSWTSAWNGTGTTLTAAHEYGNWKTFDAHVEQSDAISSCVAYAGNYQFYADNDFQLNVFRDSSQGYKWYCTLFDPSSGSNPSHLAADANAVCSFQYNELAYHQ